MYCVCRLEVVGSNPTSGQFQLFSLKLVDCLELLHLPCFNCYVNS